MSVNVICWPAGRPIRRFSAILSFSNVFWSRTSGLLIRLQLYARAQHVKVCADAGLVQERRLAKLFLVRGDKGLGVGDLGLVGKRGQIARGHGVDGAAAYVEQVPRGDRRRFLGGAVQVIVGQVDQRLVDAQLRVRHVYLDDRC